VPAASLDINAKLLYSGDLSIVGSRSFQLVQPASDTEVASVVNAFGQALDRLVPQIAGWALTTGQTHQQALHHPATRH